MVVFKPEVALSVLLRATCLAPTLRVGGEAASLPHTDGKIPARNTEPVAEVLIPTVAQQNRFRSRPCAGDGERWCGQPHVARKHFTCLHH